MTECFEVLTSVIISFKGQIPKGLRLKMTLVEINLTNWTRWIFSNLFASGPTWARGEESGPESEGEEYDFGRNLEDLYAHSWSPKKLLGFFLET